MSKILIVDDDKNIRYSFRTLMQKDGYTVDEAQDGLEALKMLRKAQFDVVVMDIRMPEISGLEMIRKIQNILPQVPVILITAFASTETAIEAMRLGAYDYILKPFKIQELKRVIAAAVEDSRLTSESVNLPETPETESGGVRIVGSAPVMQEIYKTIGKVSRSNSTVLITGPSGSGKEMVARAIFHYGHRKDFPFQAVNCAALPSELLESELFGHEKGAFTGASETKLGRFERCNNGTLFLDEIGDMSLPMQAKILRVLQEQTFERVGGTKTISVDVRVIAATNKNLEEMIANATFREDLYFRIGVVKIDVPSLRERRSDIPELVNYFIRQFQSKNDQQEKRIAKEAVEYLATFHWRGNVRELQNAIQRALVLSPGNVLRKEDFTSIMLADCESQDPLAEDLHTFSQMLFKKIADFPDIQLIPTMERILISEALQKTKGNQVQAAKLLGISRNTLRNRIMKY